jgi:hypothetical protein
MGFMSGTPDAANSVLLLSMPATMKSLAMSGLLLALSLPVACLADDTARTAISVPAGEAQPAADGLQASAPSAPLRTLDAIEALRPDIDWTPDPFARRPNRFDGAFNPGPTPEEIALQHGGYLMYGISRALYKGGAWLNRVTGGPAQIQAAQARDVPLDDEQIARAARWAGSTINGD